MNVYAFDVDHTLDVSGGPVSFDSLKELRDNGHIVGLCGNFAMVTRWCPDWHKIISFIGPMAMSKAAFLMHISGYVPAEEFIMVGNDSSIFGASKDKEAAREAGWRFIREHEFAEGSR